MFIALIKEWVGTRYHCQISLQLLSIGLYCMVTVLMEKFFILTKFDSFDSALLNLMMSSGVKGMWKNWSVLNFWVVSEILAGEPEKNHETCLDIWFPACNLHMGS